MRPLPLMFAVLVLFVAIFSFPDFFYSNLRSPYSIENLKYSVAVATQSIPGIARMNNTGSNITPPIAKPVTNPKPEPESKPESPTKPDPEPVLDPTPAPSSDPFPLPEQPATPKATGELSAAMGRWTPSRPGDCTQAQHDAYSAIGPDGKRYPIWHPPTGPGGCTFGHEHGDNPAGSPLNSQGPLLFGYVNEQHTMQNAQGHRHEDHVGHKVFAVNDFTFKPQGLHGPASPIVCNVLAKLHQGTHSPDAFTNNLHEQYSRISCDDGTYANVQLLSQIGPAGQIQEQCTGKRIEIGPAVPADSPRISNPLNPGKSMGNRFLPTPTCVDKSRPNVFEIWKTQNSIVAPNGKNAFRFAWYWGVSNPSRYYDPAQPNKMGRTIEACWAIKESDTFLVISNPCLKVRKDSAGDPIAWDDPRSPFTGTKRSVRLDSFTLRNASGPSVWYTDAMGMNPSLTPFSGSVRQEVLSKSHTPNQYIGGNVGRDHAAEGVRAPN